MIVVAPDLSAWLSFLTYPHKFHVSISVPEYVATYGPKLEPDQRLEHEVNPNTW